MECHANAQTVSPAGGIARKGAKELAKVSPAGGTARKGAKELAKVSPAGGIARKGAKELAKVSPAGGGGAKRRGWTAYATVLASLIITITTHAQNNTVQYTPSSFQGITGKVTDAATNQPLSVRIVITDDTGHVYKSYYTKLPGFFTNENGSFQLPLEPGTYSLAVYRGIDYLSNHASFQITGNNGVRADIQLQNWYPLKKEGWYCGDGHDHLYTDKKPDTAMAALVRKICIAQGVDFMFTAQGWLGYNDSNWRKGYASFSDDRFQLQYGSEMPKYRTGHTWWLGQTSTRNYFWNTMDSAYENQYYQSNIGTTWTFDELPLVNVPDVEVVPRLKRADGSLAITAHPTSWWMQRRGDIEKYVTNVAVNLSFGLLSGKIWDGLVAMGYDHDHFYYQNLWFHVLNEGYRMPGFAELDGGLGKNDKFYYGSMRNYFHIDGDFTVPKLLAAAQKGRSFLTSGPIVFADIDGRYEYGDVIPAGAAQHTLHISAMASGERDDTLSYVLVFRNGKIARLWDLRGKKQRTFTDSMVINEKERAWYIVKVYGKKAWQNTASLDVMKVCETGSREAAEGEMDVAFTNPFYFRRNGDSGPGILQSAVDLSVTSSGSVADDVLVELLVDGKSIKKLTLKHGRGKFKMPVNTILKITANGQPAIYRGLYLDYKPHRDLLEQLASGKWRDGYDSSGRTFAPGEVPWLEFNYDKTKKLLSNIKWTIELSPNVRDSLREDFGVLFE